MPRPSRAISQKLPDQRADGGVSGKLPRRESGRMGAGAVVACNGSSIDGIFLSGRSSLAIDGGDATAGSGSISAARVARRRWRSARSHLGANRTEPPFSKTGPKTGKDRAIERGAGSTGPTKASRINGLGRGSTWAGHNITIRAAAQSPSTSARKRSGLPRPVTPQHNVRDSGRHGSFCPSATLRRAAWRHSAGSPAGQRAGR